ncbi:MAG: methyltransferase domain-containing protein, partial [Pseudomonadota bacterium]
MKETGKAVMRRLSDTRFVGRWFCGDGIDIGGGDDPLSQYQEFFPLMRDCRNWDMGDGDAQKMATIENETYDFVHSSHCLEHMHDPIEALQNCGLQVAGTRSGTPCPHRRARRDRRLGGG